MFYTEWKICTLDSFCICNGVCLQNCFLLTSTICHERSLTAKWGAAYSLKQNFDKLNII